MAITIQGENARHSWGNRWVAPRRRRHTRAIKKGRYSDPFSEFQQLASRLQGGFDFESPSFQQRLRNVLGVLVAARPLPQAGGAQILVGLELVLLHHLLELGDGGGNRPNRLGLPPVRISASLSHNKSCLLRKMVCLLHLDSPGRLKDSTYKQDFFVARGFGPLTEDCLACERNRIRYS